MKILNDFHYSYVKIVAFWIHLAFKDNDLNKLDTTLPSTEAFVAKCFMRRFFRISPLHSYIKKSSPPPSPLWTNPTPEDHDLTKFDSTLSTDVLT